MESISKRRNDRLLMRRPIKNLAVFGDSILKGIVYDESENRYMTLAHPVMTSVASLPGITVDNQSRFGITSNKSLERLKKYLLTHTPDAVLIEVGGNDSNYHWDEVALYPDEDHDPLVSLASYEQNIRQTIYLLRSAGVLPLVMSLPPIDGERYYEFLSRSLSASALLKWLGDVDTIYRHQEMYNAALASIAFSESVEMIDVRSKLLELHSLRPYMCLDGLHYNAMGQSLIGQILAKRFMEREAGKNEQ